MATNNHSLDETDLTILRILQEDSKKSAKEIAARLNLTASPVYERIKRLEKQGFIKKYVVILDKKRFDLPVTAFCQVSMRYHDKTFIEQFEEQIQALEEVQECYHMAGKVDFILKINSQSLEDYHNFIKYKLSKIENIGELNSSFVLKDIKHTSALNI
ncbi:Lrp/AsnC family transcriptional regulator [Neolewinella agarilytica]|uniref:DNA-binding transcriptional regulator, Lrp family n=1 Tax=Neolewinella agarilytica TaxID=478744 RepID=A0A1H9ASZ1_9BACT|nr:Lrp/AsnC family transcriptional regulator [Neolewinella agarilytica]SEP79876.1 DNA-binding transcriptional regulator, Lrp family [Neolewinella agarilytica]